MHTRLDVVAAQTVGLTLVGATACGRGNVPVWSGSVATGVCGATTADGSVVYVLPVVVATVPAVVV